MIAKVRAKTEAKAAAVAMLMSKSSATCGNTGSSARADRLAANVASVMILSAGGSRPDPVTARSATSTRQTLDWILGERVEPEQGFDQRLEVPQRHHVGSVRRRMIGIGMGFDEDAGNADRDRRARQHRHELTLTAG